MRPLQSLPGIPPPVIQAPMGDVQGHALAAAALAPLRARSERLGAGDSSTLRAGQNTRGCRAVPAAEITRARAAG